MEKINFQNGQAPALNDTNLNQLQTNVENAINEVQTNLEEELETVKTTSDLEDITSQCTFVNSTYQNGKILVDRKNKIIYFQVLFKPTVTNDWIRVITLPNDIAPIPVSGSGSPINSTPFWFYGDHAVIGKVVKDENTAISGLGLIQ